MISSLIFQKFSGEGLTEPPPQTPPPVFSRASPSVRASPSILRRFAPSTRALRALDSGSALNFWSENLVWPPQNKLLDPPLDAHFILEEEIACGLANSAMTDSWGLHVRGLARRGVT